MKTCPYCAEDIKDQATKCRYCGSLVVSPPATEAEPADRVTYIVDRGLLRFAKFASAVLAIFITVGFFFFGMNIKQTVEELEQARDDIEVAQADLLGARETLVEAQETAENTTAELADLHGRATQLLVVIRGLSDQATREVASIRALTPDEERALNNRREEVPELFRRDANNPFVAKLWAVGTSLRVRFIGGDPETHEQILSIAREWTEHANISFTLSDDPDAEIRVRLTDGFEGVWSYLGTDALAIPSDQPSMQLSIGVDDRELRENTLHEFGHVLGLIHEHNSPNADIPWDLPAVYTYYTRMMGWSRDQVDRQVLARYDYPEGGYRIFDPTSVMWYTIPDELLTEPMAQRIRHTGLSDSDIAFAALIYPGR